MNNDWLNDTSDNTFEQNNYNQNYGDVPYQSAAKKVFAILGFSFSLTGAVLFFIPVVSLIFSILAVIFSAIGVTSYRLKGLAITGLVISIIMVTIWTIVFIAGGAALASGSLFY
jgi:hypothetical protein